MPLSPALRLAITRATLLLLLPPLAFASCQGAPVVRARISDRSVVPAAPAPPQPPRTPTAEEAAAPPPTANAPDEPPAAPPSPPGAPAVPARPTPAGPTPATPPTPEVVATTPTGPPATARPAASTSTAGAPPAPPTSRPPAAQPPPAPAAPAPGAGAQPSATVPAATSPAAAPVPAPAMPASPPAEAAPATPPAPSAPTLPAAPVAPVEPLATSPATPPTAAPAAHTLPTPAPPAAAAPAPESPPAAAPATSSPPTSPNPPVEALAAPAAAIVPPGEPGSPLPAGRTGEAVPSGYVTPGGDVTAELPTRGAREVARYSAEQFARTEQLTGLSFSPDRSKLLVSSDRSGVLQAWAIPLDGSAPTQLTDTPDSVRVIGFFPRDERLLYLADRGGDELFHLYLRDLGGQVRDLTPGDRLTARFIDWAADGRSFFVATNERDPRFFDLYEYGGFGRRMLLRNDDGYEIAAISPDKRWVALAKVQTTSDVDAWLFDTQDGTFRALTADPATVANRPQAFSPDSSALFVTTDLEGEFAALARIDLATARREIVFAPTWDVVDAQLSRDQRFLLTRTNEDGRHRLHLLDASSLRRSTLAQLPVEDVREVEVSRDGTLMAYYAGAGDRPHDLHVLELATGKTNRLSNALGTALVAADMVPAESVRLRGLDGLVVPGVLYRPHQASAERPVGALVWVHGGPGGQSRPVWSDFIQFLTNHGYAVLAINNRGSSGYGKTFFGLDDLRHGEGDLDDCVAAGRWLAAQDWVADDRVGIIGGSYGGFMVLAALAFRPEEFALGIDIFGVSNWLRTLESMPAWWGSFREALFKEMGNPATDRDYLAAISPLFHAERIVRPLLVLQGANDPRVLQVESDEIVAALRRKGTPVEYVVFPDEGHGFAKPANAARANEAILTFLEQHLRAPAPAAAEQP